MIQKSWNAKRRDEYIQQARTKAFDMVIIGGGITGAGIAREAALRNLSFCLLEKKDFAFGTSSRSSKLFHGGMRYLSSYEFGLVRESTTERNWLMHHLPNLVRPLGFLYCSYEKGKDHPLEIIAAIKLYDALSNIMTTHKNYRASRIFTPSFVEEFEPAITQFDPDLGHMRMAGFYYDTNCDDSRVTLEIIKDSLEKSNFESIATNYTKVIDYIKNPQGKVHGVVVKDELGEQTFEVKGKVVVAAGGIWTDTLLNNSSADKQKIYPTKGVHVVVPNERIGNRNAFGIRSFDDGRFFFVLRRGKVSVIGTTDTAYYPESKDLDSPWCKQEDCDYLFRTVNRLFPHAKLTYKDVIGTYAGIRPLIKSDDAKSESDVSRSHEIIESDDGIVAMAGGKSTTHRLMAEELLFYLVNKGYLPSFTNKKYHQKGFSMQPFDVGITRNMFDQLLKDNDLDDISWPDQLTYLHQQFGRQGINILQKIKEHPETGTPLLQGYPHCKAEIEYILEYENAPSIMDILCRRTEAQWMIWHYMQDELAEKVAQIASDFYGWSEEKKQSEINEYKAYIKNTIWF